jgi:hypothetical protein
MGFFSAEKLLHIVKIFFLSFLFSSCATPEGKTHDLTQKEIDDIVKFHFEEIHSCFENALTKDPDLKGKFTLAWNITPEGKVEDEIVSKSDENVKESANCALKAVTTWKFPELGGDRSAHIEYPFSFNAHPDKK